MALSRLNQARLLPESAPLSLKRIARDCGYPDTEIMRRAFIRELEYHACGIPSAFQPLLRND
ncbi:MAG: hypothetical protein R3E95_20665 [Thiolinea sp.]